MSENTATKESRWITWPKIIGGLAVAITAVLTLVFLVFPNIKPTPPPPPPGTMGGTLSNVALTYNVTCQQYINTYSSTSQCANPDEVGLLVHYRVELRGLVGQACPVNATLVDASTNQFVGGTSTVDFTPQAQDDTADTVIWLSTATITPGTYHVYLVLDNPDQVELDATSSADFPVNAG